MYKVAGRAGSKSGVEGHITAGIERGLRIERARFPKEAEDRIFAAALERCRRIVEADPVYNVEKFLNSFVPPYDKERVQQHIQEVKSARGARSREVKTGEAQQEALIARFFEQVIIDGINHAEWMGSDVCAIKASPFDDECRKTDFIMGNKGEPHVELAVDVTMSQNVNRKLIDIRGEIERGTLGSIEYFQSPYTGSRMPLTHVPRVVVGADRTAIMVLMQKWTECPDFSAATLNPNGRLKQNVRYPPLEDSYVQFQIIEQILLQLKAFEEYAKKHNQLGAGKKYEHLARLIKKIKSQKMGYKYTEAAAYMDQDAVFGKLYGSVERGLDNL